MSDDSDVVDLFYIYWPSLETALSGLDASEAFCMLLPQTAGSRKELGVRDTITNDEKNGILNDTSNERVWLGSTPADMCSDNKGNGRRQRTKDTTKEAG